MRRLGVLLVPAAVAALLVPAGVAQNLTFDERIELVRGLTAELATTKVPLPRSKKPLTVDPKGAYNKEEWEAASREFGQAARVGDAVQITKVGLEENQLVLEFNGGMKGGKGWRDRVQIGVGGRTPSTISGRDPYTVAQSGTTLAIVFPDRLPPLKAAQVKEMLAPILDFNLRSASEQYVETLPPAIQEAIKAKRALEGMNGEQVILALGRPKYKIRETKDGVELEGWVYGDPPGKITFVTFDGDKVVKVKESYAGLGGEVVPPPKTPL